MGPRFDTAYEAGWVLIPQAQGRGLGTLAVNAAHHWMDQHHPGRTVCMIDPDNTASRALAARVGYHEMARVDFDGPVILFERATT